MIVIGDTHGMNGWEELVKKHKKEKIVFLGDYFDSYNIMPLDILFNAKKLFKVASDNDNITLLLGNHDYHYLKGTSARYSGYNHTFASSYQSLLEQYRHLFKIVDKVVINDTTYLLSHAGVSNTWLKNHRTTVDDINDLFTKYPSKFNFQKEVGADSYGNNVYQSPLWIRPNALVEDAVEGYSQIVGHTFTEVKDLKDGNKLHVICSPDFEYNYKFF